jgi:hypothetical protein
MATYPDGTLLRATGPEIHLMAGGVRRWVPDPATFTHMGLDWSKVRTIPDAEWAGIPQGAPFPSRVDGTLLKGGGPEVYVTAGGQRRWIPDPETFDAGGYRWSSVRVIADADLGAIPKGEPLASVVPAPEDLPDELTAFLAELDSRPITAADLLTLQALLAQHSITATTASAIMKERSDALKALTQKL